MRIGDRFRSCAATAADAVILLFSYYLALGLRLDFGAPAYGWRAAHLAAALSVAVQIAALALMRVHRRSWGRFSAACAGRMALSLAGVAALFVALRTALPNHFWARPPYTVSIIDAGIAFLALAIPRILYAARLAARRRVPIFGRAPETVVTDAVSSAFKGRRVMVTGAGGTIGSELCRQIARLQPASLTLVERGENALYEVERRLRSELPDSVKLTPSMADVGDRRRMERVFRRERPEVVIHAAAYKHVPMVELNPKDGIANNFLATVSLARQALAYGVKRFVFISTDKAVDPVSVMGRTKRLGELTMSALSGNGRTAFCAVRFGNVLGSSGSVIPLFEEQVLRGGPVTVTDPRMTRYFMSVAEAVGLVLRAAATGEERLYVLDMGKARKITDLAEEIIRRHGYRPYIDMPIVFTGARPGEKIEEDLGVAGSGIIATEHAKIFVKSEPRVDESVLEEAEKTCRAACEDSVSDAAAREMLENSLELFFPIAPAAVK